MWPPDTQPPEVAVAYVVVMMGISWPVSCATASTAAVVAPAPTVIRPFPAGGMALKCFISITTPPLSGIV